MVSNPLNCAKPIKSDQLRVCSKASDEGDSVGWLSPPLCMRWLTGSGQIMLTDVLS